MRIPHAPPQEFWGFRYNQVVSASLYDLVVAPILDGTWVRRAAPAGSATTTAGDATAGKGAAAAQPAAVDGRRAPAWRKAVALTAAFVVSGVMHEIMIA